MCGWLVPQTEAVDRNRTASLVPYPYLPSPATVVPLPDRLHLLEHVDVHDCSVLGFVKFIFVTSLTDKNGIFGQAAGNHLPAAL